MEIERSPKQKVMVIVKPTMFHKQSLVKTWWRSWSQRYCTNKKQQLCSLSREKYNM